MSEYSDPLSDYECETVQLEPEPTVLVGLRRRMSEDEVAAFKPLTPPPSVVDFLSVFRSWLKLRYEIKQYSFGVHLNSSYPHYHFHLVCSGYKSLSNPLTTYKYDLQHNKIAVDGDVHQSIIGDQYKRWTSIQMKPSLADSNDETMFLQYPYKEKNNLTTPYLSDTDYNHIHTASPDILADASHSIYIKARAYQQNQKKEKERENNEWVDMCEHLKDVLPRTPHALMSSYLNYIKTKHEKPAHPRVLIQRVEKYLYKTGILDADMLIAQYSQFGGYLGNPEIN